MTDEIKILADYHTHTVYSHGKGTVEENVDFARSIGLKRIAITDHGINHFICGVTKKSLYKQIAEIESLRERTQGIEILTGVEANILGMSGKTDVPPELTDKLDVILCGFHKPVFAEKPGDYFKLFYNSYSHYLYRPTKAQIARNTKAYINLIRNNPIDIVTHINYHIKTDVYEVAKCASDYGTVIEISTRHNNLSPKDFERIIKSECYVALNSDAHKSENIGNCRAGLERALENGVPAERIINTYDSFTFRSKR